MEQDDDLIREFLDESNAHMDQLEKNLLIIESDPSNKEILNALFRSVHTIKGGAGFFDLNHIMKLCHEMESLFAKARNDKLIINSRILDVLLEGLDHLKSMFADVRNSNHYEPALRWIAGMDKLYSQDHPSPTGLDVHKNISNVDSLTQGQKTFQFNFSKAQFKSCVLSGKHIYLAWLKIPEDFTQSKFKNFWDFLREMTLVSEVLDSNFSEMKAVEFLNLPENHALSIEWIVVFSSILEKGLIASALGIDAASLISVTVEDFSDSGITVCKTENGTIKLIKSGTTDLNPSQESEKPDDNLAKKSTVVMSEESLRVPVHRLDRILNLTGELVLVRNRIGQIISDRLQKDTEVEAVYQTINRITHALQGEVMNTRMQQLWVLFSRFPRIVRDLAKSLSKDIDVLFEGSEVEVDKTVIEALSDPLIHMVRNTVDHGIETPAERVTQGKTPKGLLKIKAYCESGQVLIEVRDDGRGMNAVNIAEKAFEKGIITEEEKLNLSPQEKIMLIFRPGFSTADQVSSISGRGVGMDVVKANIEKIGGMVEIETEVGKGTLIRIRLPLTLAIMPGLIMLCNGQKFVIPQINIHELILLPHQLWKKKIVRWSGHDVLWYRDYPLPLIPLAECLNMERNYVCPETGERPLERRQFFSDRRVSAVPAAEHIENRRGTDRRQRDEEPLKIVVVKSGNARLALVVDEICDPEEVVVKPLPVFIDHIEHLNGTAYLGDGTLSLILDVQGIMDHLGFEPYKSEDSMLNVTEIEEQNFLWFDAGKEETFLIPLPLIRRVQPILASDLQQVGEHLCYDFRGEIFRVLKIEECLKVNPSSFSDDLAYLIFPSSSESLNVALLAHRILDTKTIAEEFSENMLNLEGVIGSTLISGKIALILDIHHVLERFMPVKSMEAKKKVRILVAEDTPFYQAILKAYLGPSGYNFDMVSNGALALEVIERSEPFDLVVSDIEMPVLDGFDLCRRIRELKAYQNVPIIAFSGLDKLEYLVKARESRFSAWVPKLEKQALLEVMRVLLDGNQILRAEYAL